MKTEILLLRHTKVIGPAALYGVTDVESNQQDNLNLAQLFPQKFQLLNNIISSPLQRCSRLAAMLFEQYPLSEQYPKSVIYNRQFQEMNFGEFDGVPFDQLKDKWQKLELFWQQPKNVEFTSGENLTQFNQRVTTAWLQLLKKYRGQTSLLVCHGGVIRMILAEVLRLDWSASALYSNLAIANGSVTKISFNDAKCQFPKVEFIGMPLLIS